MIGIIDYGVGNIKAFANIYKNLNFDYKILQSKSDFTGVDKLILPGVGSFDHAMLSLQNSGMFDILNECVLNQNIPVIGICVGMQMLAKNSEEGRCSGLGWIDATVKKFSRTDIINLPLPHMGWNSINIEKNSDILKNIENNARFYFLHSYYFESNDKDNVLATANYGRDFDCIINSNNIYGIQCHPEKSHYNGIQLLKNFGEL
ncbi:imidazole glycerol phosphate synthase subunit HisH [Campylobacter hyointestinalis]|uniref:imidazole glycerol phosphate synthase subunit HisH n=1 Tax=Campylobacter hyointestinalis TaxID=198 RepID=UPI0007275D9F|nr:imidazole glycerol phosphate synthase subunit HisH [Campylobacter hyointestinalis]RAZ45684.1 imidazole glycerol phosphate synthase subunit HisH [Campylobacter hyointestinalis subsp. lawsonii]TWO19354.1 imidazole glycerol phosphate synthase subunit HisH [Campylobacter hyointestinalis]TWO30519.1 imidazole glycerol phosphate synthase subunit HisH [Campylobacter hyointestinalis]CUU87611.1 imidazole glycerol phosphate synthase [Campylobacter hyointestinalis subsp. hyointestinalis]